jgi:hypothetical protein
MKFKRVMTSGGQFYGVTFECPGCGFSHTLPTQETPEGVTKAARWQFNGDYERPTLTPSILSRYYKPTPEGEAMMERREPLPEGMDRYPGTNEVCHSFVTDGRIQYLGDCTHALAGQTVDLPDWEEAPP